MFAWLKQLWKRVQDWWAGKYTPYDNPPDSDVFIIGLNHEMHWTARVAHALVEFYLRHWQWLWGTLLTLVGLWLAVLALR